MSINDIYNRFKNVIAYAYGIELIDGKGYFKQRPVITNNSLVTIRKLENIFDSGNLYLAKDIAFNSDLIGLCYEQGEDVGQLYHRIAIAYHIDQWGTSSKNEINDTHSVYNYMREVLDRLEYITSIQYKPTLYSVKETTDMVDHNKCDYRSTYILNILLIMFIRQIHDDIFGLRLKELSREANIT